MHVSLQYTSHWNHHWINYKDRISVALLDTVLMKTQKVIFQFEFDSSLLIKRAEMNKESSFFYKKKNIISLYKFNLLLVLFSSYFCCYFILNSIRHNSLKLSEFSKMKHYPYY